jgi:hypothetical protein
LTNLDDRTWTNVHVDNWPFPEPVKIEDEVDGIEHNAGEGPSSGSSSGLSNEFPVLRCKGLTLHRIPDWEARLNPSLSEIGVLRLFNSVIEVESGRLPLPLHLLKKESFFRGDRNNAVRLSSEREWKVTLPRELTTEMQEDLLASVRGIFDFSPPDYQTALKENLSSLFSPEVAVEAEGYIRNFTRDNILAGNRVPALAGALFESYLDQLGELSWKLSKRCRLLLEKKPEDALVEEVLSLVIEHWTRPRQGLIWEELDPSEETE